MKTREISIQKYLMIVIVSVVTLATFAAALHGYRASRSQLEMVFDEAIEAFAYVLTEIEPKHSAIIEKNVASFAYQVWQDNALLLQSPNIPNYPVAELKQGYTQQNFNGTRWHTYVLSNSGKWAIVAQPMQQRVESAEEVLIDAIAPIVWVIPLIGLLVFIAISRSLKPLKELSKQLSRKDSDDLRPIALQGNSLELKPIEKTLNHLLRRLSDAFEREKRLAADAAHELRTPISVLTITSHNLQSEFKEGRLQQNTIHELQQSVQRMAHVVEQIIALNRTTPENFNKKLIKIDLHLLLQEAISNLYSQIEKRQQQIALEGESIYILGDEFSLKTAVENIISNASKYGGNGCEIAVTCFCKNEWAHIVIDDSGPGIPDSQHEKVLQRFYRVERHSLTTQSQKQSGDDERMKGCGLGLSIVQHIVDLHGGQMQLSASDLGGLRVELTFPSLPLQESGL